MKRTKKKRKQKKSNNNKGRKRARIDVVEEEEEGECITLPTPLEQMGLQELEAEVKRLRGVLKEVNLRLELALFCVNRRKQEEEEEPDLLL